MEYNDWLGKLLKPQNDLHIKVLDLFAGCGGLALGFEAIGFKTYGYEMNSAAARSYEKNLNSVCENIKLSKDFSFPDADIVIGGPPCQPFSVGGYQLGIEDARDGFPIFIEAVTYSLAFISLYYCSRSAILSDLDLGTGSFPSSIAPPARKPQSLCHFSAQESSLAT